MEINDANRIGSILAEARRRKGLSQRAVEDVTGISNAYLSQLECGKVRGPSPKHLHALAELYDLPYADLLGAAGYPVPERAGHSASVRLAARLGPTTPDEEAALAQYLEFIRSRERGRTE